MYKEVDYEATNDYCGLYQVKKRKPVCDNLSKVKFPKIKSRVKVSVRKRGKNRREYIGVIKDIFNDNHVSIINEKNSLRESFTKSDLLTGKVELKTINSWSIFSPRPL